jgi:hypothetical protein
VVDERKQEVLGPRDAEVTPPVEQSNLLLQKLRFLTRTCKDRQCLSLNQYEYATRLINEISTEPDVWIKQQHTRQA